MQLLLRCSQSHCATPPYGVRETEVIRQVYLKVYLW